MAKWYAVIEKATGRAVSFGTDLGDPLAPELEAIEIDHQPARGEKWDPTTRAVVADARAVAIDGKRARLNGLRTKGWTNLTLAEKDEARTLAFDLREPSPPAA